MAAWSAESYSRTAVRAFLERLGPTLLFAGFAWGTLLGSLVADGPRPRFAFEFGSALTVALLLLAWWQIRRGPAERFEPSAPLDPEDQAHFHARQAERARTLGHP